MFIQKTSQGRDDVSILLPSLSRQMYISEDPRPVDVKLTGEVIIPSSSVVLPPRDDAAEYDDSGDTYHFQDDSKYVMYDWVIVGTLLALQQNPPCPCLHIIILLIHGRITVTTITHHSVVMVRHARLYTAVCISLLVSLSSCLHVMRYRVYLECTCHNF